MAWMLGAIGAGLALYALREKKRRRGFTAWLAEYEEKQEGISDLPLENPGEPADSMSEGPEKGNLQSSIEALAKANADLAKRVERLETLLDGFRRIRIPNGDRQASRKPEDGPKPLDFEAKSLSELAEETGMEKGELLFLKKYSPK